MKIIVDIYTWEYIGGNLTDTAKIFTSGRSQAVRLPKEYRFIDKEVIVRHFGNVVLK